MRLSLRALALATITGLLVGCGENEKPVGLRDGDDVPSNEEQLAKRLSGTIRIDGPQVLQPLFSAAARNFEAETPVEVGVEESGTEAALDKLCTGRVAVAGARRPMTGSERQLCDRRGIEVERLKIANHVAAVATSPELEIPCLTARQLRELWKPGSSVTRYSQLDPGLPEATVELYGPETSRDTFALFTALVNGRPGAIRRDWRPVENRHALTARLERNPNALGFFNFAQLTPVTDARLAAIDGGDGCVEPTESSVQAGRYPLREDLYLYVSKPKLEHLRVRSFMQYFLEDYAQLSGEAPATVAATEEEIAEAERRLPEAETPGG